MVLAYVDPGTSVAVINTFWMVLIGLMASLFAWFSKHIVKPLKRFFAKLGKRLKKNKEWVVIIFLLVIISIMTFSTRVTKQTKDTKVIIIGIDAMDPTVFEKLLYDGKLPNFKKLIEHGIIPSFEPRIHRKALSPGRLQRRG